MGAKNHRREVPTWWKNQDVARAAYERMRLDRRFSGDLPDYDRMLAEYQTGDSFRAIGFRLNRSRERVRVIHRYFCQFLPEQLSGKDRLRAAVQRTRAERSQVVIEDLLENPIFRPLAKRARECGVSFQLSLVRKNELVVRWERWYVELNGLRCRLAVYTRRYTVRGRDYWHPVVQKTPIDYRFFIVQIKARTVQRFFVIPANVLRPNLNLYIPTGEYSTYKNHKPLRDWLQYEDAWHLLKSLKRKAARRRAA